MISSFSIKLFFHGSLVIFMIYFLKKCISAKTDVFVTIGLGKDKYQTSPKEQTLESEFIEWHEVCEL